MSLFYLSLKDILSAGEAGWLGCAMTMSGCCGSVVVGGVLDRFQGRLKRCIVVLLACSAFALLAFATVGLVYTSNSNDDNDDNDGSGGNRSLGRSDTVMLLYITGVAGGFFFNTTTPLFFELAMETVYGWASENASSMVLILANTIFAIIFTALPTKMGGTTQWPSWLCSGSVAATAAFLCCVPIRYSRLEVDDMSSPTYAQLEGANDHESITDNSETMRNSGKSCKRRNLGCAFDRSGCVRVPGDDD